MLKRVFLALLLVAARSDDFENAEDEDELNEFDAENFDEDGYGGGDGGYGGYGGGYGDDEYGGGGDPTPAYEPIESFAGIQEFLAQDETEPGIVGFFDEERDEEAKKVFESVAEDKRYDFRFGMVTDEAARTEAKLQKGPAVIVYPPPRFVSDKYEKKRARFPGKALEAEALKKFMYKKSVPLVGQKTWKSGERYDKQGVPVVTLFAAIDLEKNSKGYEYFANRVRKVAADFTGKLSFNIGDKEDFSYQLEDYDLSLDGKKDVGVGAKDGSKYYKMDSKFNVDNLRAFAEGIIAGTLTPKIKEEPSYDDYDADEPADDGPADYEGSDVAQLTTDNYAELTDGKDAMLEFYAPWCGHCQQLKPTYKELGTALAGAETVVVGAMDATANEPPEGIEVSGYPTLIFKKASGETMPYDGERDVDSMVKFIKENADSDVKVEL